MNKKNDVRWAVLLYLNYPLTLFLKFGGIFLCPFPLNSISITYNRKGHRAFAVFLLSFFIGMCRRVVSAVGCRSPPFQSGFYIFKNSDWRKIR